MAEFYFIGYFFKKIVISYMAEFYFIFSKSFSLFCYSVSYSLTQKHMDNKSDYSLISMLQTRIIDILVTVILSNIFVLSRNLVFLFPPLICVFVSFNQ